MLFLSVHETEFLNAMKADGLVGLSPTSLKSQEQPTSIVEVLFQAGQIGSKVFSFSMQSEDQSSMMTIGGYDLEKYASNAQL